MSDDEFVEASIKQQRKLFDYQARIRELEAALEEADRQARKLEALVEKVVAWEGKGPTHVIVPVEPNMDVLNIGALAFEDAQGRGYTRQVCMMWAHTAMIRAAAKEKADGGNV